jgi:L-lactate dehydrogenase complex protein LldG
MTAREEILHRIRTALPPDAPAITAPRAYHRTGNRNAEETIELFIDRLTDYDAEILYADTVAEIPLAIGFALSHANEHSALAAREFPTAWLPSGISVLLDDGLSHDQIEGIPAVITTCEAAVASTGTIFLVHRGAQGRRVLTLLPDHHICLIQRTQVFELLPEALTAIRPLATEPVTTISGPSATSDIEMTRIRGVHGPRRLTVVLCG